MAAHLAQEMTVQAAAIEAARSNVEHHYSYICTHFKEFMAWWGSLLEHMLALSAAIKLRLTDRLALECLLGSPETCQHIAT